NATGDVQWLNVYDDIIEFKSVIEMPGTPPLPNTLVACGWRVEPPSTGPEVAVMVQTDSLGTPLLAVDVWSNKGGAAIPGDARFAQVIQTGPDVVTLVGSANRTMNAGQLVDSDVLIFQYSLVPGVGMIHQAVYGQTLDTTGTYGIVEEGKAIAPLDPS